MKKYFIRALAALPLLSSGVSMVVFLVMAFETHWWVLLAIGNLLAFSRVAQDYEWCVRDFAKYLKRMAEDAMYE